MGADSVLKLYPVTFVDIQNSYSTLSLVVQNHNWIFFFRFIMEIIQSLTIILFLSTHFYTSNDDPQ